MKKYNYICRDHEYSRKSAFGGNCPFCGKELVCIGDKFRIGHCGQFDKVERKTRNLDGQKPVLTQRQQKLIRQQLRDIKSICRGQ